MTCAILFIAKWRAESDIGLAALACCGANRLKIFVSPHFLDKFTALTKNVFLVNRFYKIWKSAMNDNWISKWDYLRCILFRRIMEFGSFFCCRGMPVVWFTLHIMVSEALPDILRIGRFSTVSYGQTWRNCHSFHECRISCFAYRGHIWSKNIPTDSQCFSIRCTRS